MVGDPLERVQDRNPLKPSQYLEKVEVRVDGDRVGRVLGSWQCVVRGDA